MHLSFLITKKKNMFTHLDFNGRFLNFASESITTHFDVYISKNNPDWSATSMFVVDEILELAGAVTKLEDIPLHTARINKTVM